MKKYKEPLSETFITFAVYTTVFLVAFFTWVGFSHFEAKSYTELTGKKVSTWSAMFLDLRVQEAVKGE